MDSSGSHSGAEMPAIQTVSQGKGKSQETCSEKPNVEVTLTITYKGNTGCATALGIWCCLTLHCSGFIIMGFKARLISNPTCPLICS